MNKLFTQLVEKRGLSSGFLHPKYEDLRPAEEMPDMKKATSRIKKAIKNREKILIYGDYDVDGVTASTVMAEALELSGAREVSIMLPDRFKDGYGMSMRLVERAKAEGVGLVITVDCGSRNFEIIEALFKLKIDTIVTDHHECDDDLPEAVAVVNAKRKDFAGAKELRDLAGVGVAFKVAEGLRDAGLIRDGQEKWMLDLVLIGTICDQMRMTGENRVLCYFGKVVLEKTRRPGLKELIKKAGVKAITAESIGFQIGPRLNSAGRLASAEIALNLLRAKTGVEAAKIAEELEKLNKIRRDTQLLAMNEIKKRGVDDAPVIIETGDYPEGILGIVAGHLVEEYKRPAFVLTEVDGGVLKGSGRSFGDFNLAEALKSAEGAIIGGGGHAEAAGVRLEKGNLKVFSEAVNNYYQGLNLVDQGRYFRKTPDLFVRDFADLSLELVENLRTLEPFGNGNAEPLFCLENAKILGATRMGKEKNHLRLDAGDDRGGRLKCVAFGAPESWFNLDEYTPQNLLIRPLENEFRGVRSVEARLVDVL